MRAGARTLCFSSVAAISIRLWQWDHFRVEQVCLIHLFPSSAGSTIVVGIAMNDRIRCRLGTTISSARGAYGTGE